MSRGVRIGDRRAFQGRAKIATIEFERALQTAITRRPHAGQRAKLCERKFQQLPQPSHHLQYVPGEIDGMEAARAGPYQHR